MRYNEVERARAVYERYVDILPSVKAWVRFAKFELQNNDVARSRSCYERAMEALGEDANTVSHSCLLMQCGINFHQLMACDTIILSCCSTSTLCVYVLYRCFGLSCQSVVPAALFCVCAKCVCLQEEFFLRFAEFEEIVKEPERARAIYKYALDHLPKAAAQQLYTRFVAFEKQHGTRWAGCVLSSAPVV